MQWLPKYTSATLSSCHMDDQHFDGRDVDHTGVKNGKKSFAELTPSQSKEKYKNMYLNNWYFGN